jgi:hypothetical protein
MSETVEVNPFGVDQTEDGSAAIHALTRAALQIHEALRRADPMVRRSFLREARRDLEAANQSLLSAETLVAMHIQIRKSP